MNFMMNMYNMSYDELHNITILYLRCVLIELFCLANTSITVHIDGIISGTLNLCLLKYFTDLSFQLFK